MMSVMVTAIVMMTIMCSLFFKKEFSFYIRLSKVHTCFISSKYSVHSPISCCIFFFVFLFIFLLSPPPNMNTVMARRLTIFLASNTNFYISKLFKNLFPVNRTPVTRSIFSSWLNGSPLYQNSAA